MKQLILEAEKHIGQVVTIFTSSGGISGCGFTGILISVGIDFIQLLVCIGDYPNCPLNCRNRIKKINSNPLGAITIIPLSSIVAFTYSSI